MGTALEWLSSTGCKAVAMEILSHPEQPKYGRPEIWAHCPFHSERTPGGAFSYNYDKDQAKCQSCGATGDLITVYSQIHGLGKENGFLEFKKKYAPTASGKPVGARRTVPSHAPENYFAKDKDHYKTVAPEKWIERAGSFVEHSFSRLMNSNKAIDELEKRWGITVDTAMKCGFGMNDVSKSFPGSAWGCDDIEKIWLPKGLVMPCMVDGQVRKIKIRRPDSDVQKSKVKLPYIEVNGGENYRFHIYGSVESGFKPDSTKILVVIEAERDAALVWQECATVFGDTLVATAGGGAAKRPHDDKIIALVKTAEVILVALDTDRPGADNSIKFWEHNFGAAKYWPVPARYMDEKKKKADVGDAFKKGLDIRAWIMAGLPEYMKARFEVFGEEI